MTYQFLTSSSDGGFNGNGNGDGHHHHHHNPDNTYNTGEATSSADGGTSQSAEPTSPVSGASPTSQSSNSQSSAIGQDGSSSTDPTSSASGGASSSTSVSDPSITSFPSSTESSTTVSLDFNHTTRTWLTIRLHVIQTGIPSSASESATPQNAAAIGPNKGAIAGGVVGGMFGLAVIVIACFLLYKTRRRKHMAPSSEFMAVTGNPASFSRLGTRADDPSEMPPPFTQGNFNTPAYEKNAMGESHLPL